MADLKLCPLPLPTDSNTLPALANFSLNQSADAAEFVLQAPPGVSSYTVTRLVIRQGSVTGTAPTYRASVQGVDGGGNPDGTIKGGGSAFADYTPVVGNNNTQQELTLGASASLSPGEFFSVVVKYQSGTIDASNLSTFSVGQGGNVHNFPYSIQNDNASRARQAVIPAVGWGTASALYGFPVKAVTAQSFNSGSTPDEYALLFSMPAGSCTTFQVAGVWLWLLAPAGATLRVTLYDSDGTTVLQQTDYDGDAATSNAAGRLLPVMFDEATLATLLPGTDYRLSLTPQSATSWTVYYIDVNNAADLDAYPFGRAWYTSTRSDAGAWSAATTRRLYVAPVLAALTAAGGGVRRQAGMTGGMAG